ncbi:hypothetical protein CYMTET_30021 [Cymbomonas tetramitiformis]|uniref:Uncharacterized protein n=2 Tax=Cymbomonas tetramitiformis TaxID=36881 RepID=A0AAE0FJX6_9CHLO|nr:hypothetical protein CYMTET_30021 [Cymbomonas tetramitiformis]
MTPGSPDWDLPEAQLGRDIAGSAAPQWELLPQAPHGVAHHAVPLQTGGGGQRLAPCAPPHGRRQQWQEGPAAEISGEDEKGLAWYMRQHEMLQEQPPRGPQHHAPASSSARPPAQKGGQRMPLGGPKGRSPHASSVQKGKSRMMGANEQRGRSQASTSSSATSFHAPQYHPQIAEPHWGASREQGVDTNASSHNYRSQSLHQMPPHWRQKGKGKNQRR